MTLPRLENWLNTRLGLHHAAQVVGGVRRAVANPEPNWAHLGLRTTPDGVTTGPLPKLGSIDLLFSDRAIVWEQHRIPLEGHTQISLADAVETLLRSNGQNVTIDRSKITNVEPIQVNGAQASDYAKVLSFMSGVLSRFRDSLSGEKSALVVWPHGFDSSFLWFAGEADEKKPHLSFGFSPGSEGFPDPYLYAYAWPVPEGLLALSLPHDARWYQGSWTGLVLDYPILIESKNPDAAIIETFQTMYEQAAPHLKQALKP